MANIETDVVIVGGGGCGLTLSILLSNYGVSHYLFERHSTTSIIPKAHLINQRSMEIFRQHGIAPLLQAVGGPEHHMSRVSWMSSLGGDGEFHRRRFGSIPAFGASAGPDHETTHRIKGAVGSINLPQVRLEPLLRKEAEKRNQGKVLFSHNVVDFAQSADEVRVVVESSKGETIKVRAKYLVGADGGKTVGDKVGAELDIASGFANIVTTHFKANLAEYWHDEDFLVNIFGTYGEAGILPMGPVWGKHSPEWIIHQVFPPTGDVQFTEEEIKGRIRDLLAIPDLGIEVLKTSQWVPERALASRYSYGRVHLAGDAAHRHPPTGGLGLNTGIGDAHNLAWKLALVLRGSANPRLLASYEEERQPVGERNCDWAMMSFLHRTVLDSAIGLSRNEPLQNIWRLRTLFGDGPTGKASLALIAQTLALQGIEFDAHDMEMGYVYKDGALVPDGTPVPDLDPSGHTYTQNARPGHRLPHLWLRKQGLAASELISTHDLVDVNNIFALITDASDTHYGPAAKRAAEQAGVNLIVARIDSEQRNSTSDSFQPQGDWHALAQTHKGGAILVRPDNVVVWRAAGASTRNGAEAADALFSVLGKQSLARL